MVTLSLHPAEISTVLGWYEYAQDDSFHYGGGALLIPSETILAEKLSKQKDQTCEVTDQEIEIIGDWMDKALSRKYGSAKYALPVERIVYDRIATAMARIEQERESRKDPRQSRTPPP